MKTDKVWGQLEEVGMAMTQQALAYLKAKPKGSPLACSAVVIDGEGDLNVVLIGDPARRIDALKFMASSLGSVVGFALVFDGYVSTQATSPAMTSQPRIDAIVTVVRTKWGQSATKSVAYGYDAEGHFELRPERDVEAKDFDGQVLDGYDVVFGPTSVH